MKYWYAQSYKKWPRIPLSEMVPGLRYGIAISGCTGRLKEITSDTVIFEEIVNPGDLEIDPDGTMSFSLDDFHQLPDKQTHPSVIFPPDDERPVSKCDDDNGFRP